jgi:hypothetical protein
MSDSCCCSIWSILCAPISSSAIADDALTGLGVARRAATVQIRTSARHDPDAWIAYEGQHRIIREPRRTRASLRERLH